MILELHFDIISAHHAFLICTSPLKKMTPNQSFQERLLSLSRGVFNIPNVTSTPVAPFICFGNPRFQVSNQLGASYGSASQPPKVWQVEGEETLRN